ncbi:MAG TPA: uracil-DNA glycosylase family protein [Bryobacteraceae bacterium]|nr:uracil-DNA glycosylase family protein [Bryobacteraceae bacterium]
MLHDLEKYYRAQNIYPEDFHCCHLDECSKNCAKFTEATSAFVGTQYERGSFPRLLFISLDPGSGEKGDPDPIKRTPKFVREDIERLDGRKIGKFQHWRETHRLAVVLLRQFDPSISLETVTPFFAHVNSAKCTENNPSNAVAKHVLFENCRQYLHGELSVLKPDVIVTQGVEAANSLSIVLKGVNPAFGTARQVILAGRPILWVKTYHPSARQRFREEKTKWPEFASALGDFIQLREGCDSEPEDRNLLSKFLPN